MKKNSVLRAQAREQLGGKIFATNWLLMLVAGVIVSVASSLATELTLFLGGIGLVVILGALQYGNARL